METINKIPSRIIEIETSIKLLEYLKRENVIDDGMYNFCINKLMNKLTLEKSKINELKKMLDNCLNDDECFSDIFN